VLLILAALSFMTPKRRRARSQFIHLVKTTTANANTPQNFGWVFPNTVKQKSRAALAKREK
jgi:hypothetical protein